MRPCWSATGSPTAAGRARPTTSMHAATCSPGAAARGARRRRSRASPTCCNLVRPSGGRLAPARVHPGPWRSSMRIGPVESDSPFLLAPLAGVSDSPFRRLAREQGASVVYTEMVSADGLVRGNQATLDYCRFDPSERPIGIQLFGANPDVMADAARRLSDLPD